MDKHPSHAAEISYSFGYLLRRLRKARDLTQEMLAQRAGCAVDTVRKIEADARRPSRALAHRLAASLDLTGDEHSLFVATARGSRAADQLGVAGQALFDHAALLEHPGLQASPRQAGTPLPGQPTPFIGRITELAKLEALLASPDHRLITIYGLGGVGKTRLALYAASQWQQRHPEGDPRFPDGVMFVPLANCTSAAMIVAAIASAIDLPPHTGSRPIRQHLLDYLHTRRLLLVLDNYEPQPDTIELVARILQATMYVTLLVTARERLWLREEYLLHLEGLPVPPDTSGVGTADFDAVRLFLQAAEHVVPGIAPGDDDLAWIATICRLVDGLPLAIELAAAWLTVLTPAEIATELQRSQDLLATRLSDVPPRQRNLHAVWDATWQRVSPADQQVFARLTVCQGGFSLQAAQTIAGADLPGMARLVAHSLLHADAEHGCYRIQRLLRQYGAAHLAQDPQELEQTRQRHARYYAAVLAQRDAAATLPVQPAPDCEHENIRAAWAYALERGELALLAGMADPLGRYYMRQRAQYLGAEAFAAAVKAVAELPSTAEQARVLVCLAGWLDRFRAAHDLAAGDGDLATITGNRTPSSTGRSSPAG